MTTPPGAWPSREEIAEIIAKHASGMSGGTPTPWVFVLADEILARLRPAGEHEHWKRVQNEQAYDREVELHEETRKQLDALRADLARARDEIDKIRGRIRAALARPGVQAVKP